MSDNKSTRPGVAAPERAEIGNAASNFRIDCTAGNPARQLKISVFLGIGAETGLTIRDLERMTGKPGRENREGKSGGKSSRNGLPVCQFLPTTVTGIFCHGTNWKSRFA